MLHNYHKALSFSVLFLIQLAVIPQGHAQGKAGPITGQLVPVVSLHNLGKVGFDMASKQTERAYTEEVSSLFFKITSPVVTTHFIAGMYKEYELPRETFTIKFPVITGAKDTLAGQWILKGDNPPHERIIHTILLGLQPDSNITFFIDFNNNHDFTDDGTPYTFPSYVTQRSFTISDPLKGDFSFTLTNPNEARRMKKFSRTGVNKSWSESRLKPTVNFDLKLATAGGTMIMEYLSNSPFVNSQYKYEAQYQTSLEVHLQATAAYRGFQAGGLLIYEETEIGQLLKTQRYTDNTGHVLEKKSNEGRWPHSALMYGFTASYDLSLPFLKGFYIGPVVAAGWLNYLNDDVFFYKSLKEPVSETFTDGTWYHAGFNLKLLFTEHSILYFSYQQRILSYDAINNFPGAVAGSFSQSHTVNSYGLGIQYRF